MKNVTATNLKVCATLVACLILAAGWSWGWNEPFSLGQETSEQSETESELSEEATSSDQPKVIIGQSRPWSKPDYSSQQNALGWTPDLFKVPVGLRARVDFWIDIYTKYSTDQGIIHDSEHVNVIYTTVDFNDIESNTNLTDSAKRKLRKRRVEDKKREINQRLLKLAKIKVANDLSIPEGLDDEDRRIWLMFKGINEKDRFVNATRRKRIRFQLGQRDRFIQGIYYSGRYLPEMEQIFRTAGIPVELTRLPFVESSFNVKARSRVGASGIWQFMRYTGRRLLRINYAVDERNDPIKATHAAARFMRMNYDILKKWPLAITAYNHGAAGVRRMVERYKTDDIVELADERHGRFKFASANFYATFLAALEVEKNADRYFGKITWDLPLESKDVPIGKKKINRTLLTEWFNGDRQKAMDWNPHLSQAFWLGYARISSQDLVRVPASNFEAAINSLDQIPQTEIAADHNDLNVYFIGHGETLSEIAAELGVPLRALVELNGIVNPRRVRAGQKLFVPKNR